MEQQNTIEGIEKLKAYLPEGKMEELAEILAYGEKMEAEGERLKKEFRSKHKRREFLKLLQTVDDRKKYYEIGNNMTGIEREKFIEEYMENVVLYSGDPENIKSIEWKDYNEYDNNKFVIQEGSHIQIGKVGGRRFEPILHTELKKFVKLTFLQVGGEGAKAIAENMKLKEGVILDLGSNEIGDDGAKAIAEKMELKKGVTLDLSSNKIGPDGVGELANMKLQEGVVLNLSRNYQIGNAGAKAIAENIRLKEGVVLHLVGTYIGPEGAESLSKMELKKGVELNLRGNEIGDEGAKAIAKNMKLQEGVELHIPNNQIGDAGAEALSKMELKKGVTLDLRDNEIGDKGAQAFIDNMELKEGVSLNLGSNKNISPEMKKKLEARAQSQRDNGVDCYVLTFTN